ncbi:MAG TPA: zinc-ribbon domain-containing protein, partial [Chthonomonadales bacterium]|nr:zinc-ribbon domain-containing protein [Chthonomonadales bacterium]
MFCTTCGTRNGISSKFCKQCGAALEPTSPNRISEEEYDKALPDEEQVGLLLERAYQLRNQNKLEAAIVSCEDALKLRPNSTSVHALLAQLWEAHGDKDRAI